MTRVKTAISIQKSLFEKVDDLVRKMNVLRSKVFVMAVEEYLRRHQNRQLLAELNQAYEDELTPEENEYLDWMRWQQKAVVLRGFGSVQPASEVLQRTNPFTMYT